jgi:para-nitrobenzyl esterase
VSALVASPLAKGLFQRAIGESGAYFSSDALPLKPRTETEKADVEFAKTALGTSSLQELRAKPAAEILQASLKETQLRFQPNIDGYFLPEDVATIYARGHQAQVPLLAGWNLDEQGYRNLLGRDAPTPENFRAHLQTLFGARAEEAARLYAGTTPDEVKRAAQDLASDRFIAFSTWKWLEAQMKTTTQPVYRYKFDETLPTPEATAPHASEIEFVFQVLSSRKLPWRPEDRKVADLMGTYWSNFAKTGNPNGEGVPNWPIYRGTYPVMHLTADPKVIPDEYRARYLFLDSVRK